MKQRVLNPNNKSFKNYGGRGISVSLSWRNSFQSFINDMGRRPTDKHQLDRIDNNKGYCKDNCRWALGFENQLNKRKLKGIFPRGIRMSGYKYRAYISVDTKVYHIGNFPTIEEAILQRDLNYKEWYGK